MKVFDLSDQSVAWVQEGRAIGFVRLIQVGKVGDQPAGLLLDIAIPDRRFDVDEIKVWLREDKVFPTTTSCFSSENGVDLYRLSFSLPNDSFELKVGFTKEDSLPLFEAGDLDKIDKAKASLERGERDEFTYFKQW